jgi:hypothetical protein
MGTSDFDERMEKIKSILQEFKGKYFDTETQNTLNARDLKAIYLKFTMYTDAPLKSYLNYCLANEATHCEEDKIETIVAENTPVETNTVGAPDVFKLLKDINKYMSPWDPRLNAMVGALFATFIEHPFSMNVRPDRKEHVTLN